MLFVIAVNFQNVVWYNHEISLRKDAKPNQKVELVRYNRELIVTVMVITEFDCIELWEFKFLRPIVVHRPLSRKWDLKLE